MAANTVKAPRLSVISGPGVPNDAELEPSGGVSYRLGWAAKAGSVRLGVEHATTVIGHRLSKLGLPNQRPHAPNGLKPTARHEPRVDTTDPSP